jgi:hypothetical protein
MGRWPQFVVIDVEVLCVGQTMGEGLVEVLRPVCRRGIWLLGDAFVMGLLLLELLLLLVGIFLHVGQFDNLRRYKVETLR